MLVRIFDLSTQRLFHYGPKCQPAGGAGGIHAVQYFIATHLIFIEVLELEAGDQATGPKKNRPKNIYIWGLKA